MLKKILLIGDAHIPYEDKKAFDLMLRAARRFKPDIVVINGDFADFYGVSSHNKNPARALQLDKEMAAVINRLKQLKAIGARDNYFIGGNHEDRLERYLRDKAPELHNFISIPSVLKLKELGFKYVAYKQHMNIGKLYITHDVGVAGRYSHYTAVNTFQKSIATGHTHRIGYAVEGDARGKRHVTAMFGWLGDVNEVDYQSRMKSTRDWSLGFGIGYVDTTTDNVYLTPVPIINYTVVINGQLIK